MIDYEKYKRFCEVIEVDGHRFPIRLSEQEQQQAVIALKKMEWSDR